MVPEYKKLWDEMVAYHRKNGVGPVNAVEIISILLAHSADPNSKHMHGFTPFLHAAENGHEEIFFKLLNAGGKIREKDVSGQTILFAMKSRGHNDLAKELLSHINDEDVLWLKQQPDPRGYDPNRIAYY